MKKIYNILLALFLGANFQVVGQIDYKTEVKPELDISVRHGKLKNGFTYYIKDLPNETAKLNLRLFTKVGSNHENDNEMDMAHFLEHMAFKKTKHFSQGIHHFIEQSKDITMSMYDVKGFSGALVTEYQFDAPSGNDQALETGLLWFEDIAQDLVLTTEEIDSERGVIQQEMINSNADNFTKSYNKSRLEAKLQPCKDDFSNFFEHHKNFNPEILRNFYREMYIPQAMALVVVGNINNMDTFERKVQSTFSNLKQRKITRLEPRCDSIYYNQDPQFALIERQTDSSLENQEVTINFLYRDPRGQEKIPGFEHIRRDKELMLLLEILNKRFREKTKTYDSFFEIQADHTNRTHQEPSMFKIKINSFGNRELEAIKSSIQTISQLIKGGALEIELMEAINNQIAQLPKSIPGNSKFWLDGIKSHFIYGISFPAKKIKMEKKWLEEYSILEFNKFLKLLKLSMPEDIGILAPKNHKAFKYSEKEIRSLISSEYKKPVRNYSRHPVPDNLMTIREIQNLKENKIEGVAVVDHNKHKEVILQNGVKIVLKSFNPTAGPDQKKIMIHGFKPTGALNFNSEHYFSAINAPQIIKSAGIGDMNKFEFQRYLSKSSLWWYGIRSYINNKESGIQISANPEDFEELLQVIYLFFSEPNIDKDAFNYWKLNEIKNFEDQSIDLKHIDLAGNIDQFIGDDSGVLLGTKKFNGLEKVNLQDAYDIYTQVFGNSSDFTFIITGDFSIEKYLPLINKYLGNLPVKRLDSHKNKINQSKKNIPEGPIYVEYYYPTNYNKKNWMYNPYHLILNQNEFDWKEVLRVEALGAIINTRAWDLRFNKGFSLYNVGAKGGYNDETGQYRINTVFNCEPNELLLIRKEYAEIIKNLKIQLVSNEVLSHSLKRLKFLYGPDGRGMTNKTINEVLYAHYRFGHPVVDVEVMRDFLNSIKPEDIREAALKYLDEKNLYEFVIKNREF